VKLAALSPEIRTRCTEVILHTGQHYDYLMDRIFFDELGIPVPEYHLEVGSGSHGSQTGKMLERIEAVLIREQPDMTIVFGDTNSTLAGAIAAAKLQIPVAHVEAGVRSFDRAMPEELNRVMVDHVSTLLFCPTRAAVAHLAQEGITGGVHCTGDVMADILARCLELARTRSHLLSDLGIEPHGYSMVTVHRPENTDRAEHLRSIMAALGALQEQFIFPCHPRTARCMAAIGLDEAVPPNVRIIPPVGFLDMLTLEHNARVILTDSGGIQKEAYLLGVPCITLRKNTEWMETVESGSNVLTGADTAAIIRAVRNPPRPNGRPALARVGASRRITEIIAGGGA
jgi:UDP-N-acetylglucosamine 2-epimerase